MVKIIRRHWSIFSKIFFLIFFFVAAFTASQYFFYSAVSNFFSPLPAKGASPTSTWVGGATGNWQNAANWDNGVPTSTMGVDISSTTAITVTATGTINFDLLKVGGGSASSTLILVGSIGAGTTIDIQSNGKITESSTAQQTISGTLTIEAGGRLSHAANTSTQGFNLNFNANSITLNAGGIITANGLGFPGGSSAPGQGPGGGKGTGGGPGGGGAHGGDGGNGVNGATILLGGQGNCDVTNISTIGSGGGGGSGTVGVAGGGLIILTATSTITINGSITADGADSGGNGGGGAGGGIKLTADIISGTPSSFTASGGPGGGAGGGGCVFLGYTTSNTISPTSSYFAVNGGVGSSKNGGGGIALVKQTSANGGLYVLSNVAAAAVTQPSSTVSAITANFIYVSSSIFQVIANKTFTLVNSDPFSGNGLGEIRVYGSMAESGGVFNTIHDTALTIESAGSVTVSSTFTASSSLNLYNGFIGIATDTFTNLIIQSGTTTVYNYTTSSNPLMLTNLTMNGGFLSHATNTLSQANILNVAATNNITINASATIYVTGFGYPGASSANGQGPGPGHGNGGGAGGGGAHGGNGGQGSVGANFVGGTAYCDITNVSTMGSGGGGGSGTNGVAGAGLIILAATSTITINGTIKADGLASGGNGGGGGGGGVRLRANTISGTPVSFSAAGGAGGGGGGGGCVSISYSASNSIVTSSPYFSISGGTGSSNNGSVGVTQLTLLNTAPTVTAIYPRQTSANIVTITTTIADVDSNTTTLAVLYSTDGVTWASSTIVNVMYS